MSIQNYELLRYTIPLKKPLFIKGRNLTEREGLLVRLKSVDGYEGWGEAAPLPGFSRETLEEVEEELTLILPGYLNRKVPIETFLRENSHKKICPSTSFGLECALLMIAALQKKIPLYEFLGGKLVSSIPLVGLLFGGGEEELAAEVERMYVDGFRHFKLKVSAAGADSWVGFIERLVKNYKGIRLRLDANQSFNMTEATDFVQQLPQKSIEYIEEPFPNPLLDLSSLKIFTTVGQIPIALDESLRDKNPKQFLPIPGLKSIILKPSRFGGIRKTVEWIQWGKLHGVTPVLSSSFESGIGLWFLIQLAVVNNCLPAGMDTLKWFEHDVFKRSFLFSQGNVEIPPNIFSPNNFNQILLTQIHHG